MDTEVEHDLGTDAGLAAMVTALDVSEREDRLADSASDVLASFLSNGGTRRLQRRSGRRVGSPAWAA